VTIKIRLARRLERATRGLLGDVESVSGDVSEMREHVGAG
jgi:putative component of toxin-antitoxin plasmid stabilization module